MIQDKLCILCMDLLKSSSTPPRWNDWEEKLAHVQLYIQPVCNSKDHPLPPPPGPQFCSRFFLHHYLILPFMESVGHFLSEIKQSSCCRWVQVFAYFLTATPPHLQLHITLKWDQTLIYFCKKTFMEYLLLLEIFVFT